MKSLKVTWTYDPFESSTRVVYTSNGKYLLALGEEGMVKRYEIGTSNEPSDAFLEGESLTAIDSTDNLFVVGTKNSPMAKVFSVDDMAEVSTVTRSTMAVRDVKFSPDQRWVAAAGEDEVVKIVEWNDVLNTFKLPDLAGGVRHISFDPKGLYLAASGNDATVRIFSLSSQSPELVSKITDIVPKADVDLEDTFTGVAWHPSGGKLALQTKSREIAILTDKNGEWQEDVSQRLKGNDEASHVTPINDIRWSPNGKFLASCDGRRLFVWDEAGNVVATHESDKSRGDIVSIAWDPSKNALTYATVSGLMNVFTDPVPEVADVTNGHDKENVSPEGEGERRRTKEELFGEDSDMDVDDFIEDDDDGGYVEHHKQASHYSHKRSHNGVANEHDRKRYRYDVKMDKPVLHSGGTPWQNNRRYLCMNYVGYIWAVKQDGHNVVTVTFHDKGVNTEYHFTDYNEFSMASLSSEASLCANDRTASLRFHRGNRAGNWEYEVAESDKIRAVSLSDTMVVICTEKGYVRVFNLHGTSIQVFRQRRDPVVAVSTFRNDVMLVRTNSIGQLTCTILNPKINSIYVKEEAVDIAPDQELIAVFFSDNGDPCIFDSDGVLLVLAHWREPLQSKWVPLLDTTQLPDSNGRKYWPVGVVEEQLNAIVLREGREAYPPIPMPIFEPFNVTVPSDPSLSEIEQQYLTKQALYNLQKDRDPEDGFADRLVEIDKILLQQFNQSCTDRRTINKSLGIVHLLSQTNALDIAKKIALRHDMVKLAERIEEYRGQREPKD